MKADADPQGAMAAATGRRNEIVNATIQVIQKKGIGGATMRAIAREMGLTTGVISHHFSDKNELLTEALKTGFQPWFEALEAGPTLGGPWERLRYLFLTTVLKRCDSKRGSRVWVGMLLQIKLEENLWEVYKSQYGVMREEVFALFRECQKQGFIRDDLDPVIECNHLFALSDGLIISAFGEPDRFTTDMVREIMTLQLARLQPQPNA